MSAAKVVSNYIDDAPHPSGDDRYALYAVRRGGDRVRLCETKLRDVGGALLTMIEEGQHDPETERFGLFDRLERKWLVNPWTR